MASCSSCCCPSLLCNNTTMRGRQQWLPAGGEHNEATASRLPRDLRFVGRESSSELDHKKERFGHFCSQNGRRGDCGSCVNIMHNAWLIAAPQAATTRRRSSAVFPLCACMFVCIVCVLCEYFEIVCARQQQ